MCMHVCVRVVTNVWGQKGAESMPQRHREPLEVCSYIEYIVNIVLLCKYAPRSTDLGMWTGMPHHLWMRHKEMKILYRLWALAHGGGCGHFPPSCPNVVFFQYLSVAIAMEPRERCWSQLC